jgi:hypothetical protein
MGTPSLKQLTNALRQAWNAETGYAGVGVWTSSNPSRGQCVTSSLVVQDYFGGDIVRYEVKGVGIDETHYFNILDDGTIIDTTGSQYKITVSMHPKPVKLGEYPTLRDKRLADEETRARYYLLKSKVEVLLLAV